MNITAEKIRETAAKRRAEIKAKNEKRFNAIKKSASFLAAVKYIENCIKDAADDGMIGCSVDSNELNFKRRDNYGQDHIDLIIAELKENGFDASYQYYEANWEVMNDFDGEFVIAWDDKVK